MTVEMNVASVGSIYPITDESNPAAQGQLTAVAEIKGAVHPEKRVLVLSHVQEPSSNDNATGVGLNVELATKMKPDDRRRRHRPSRLHHHFPLGRGV